MAELLSVNLGVTRSSPATRIGATGIDKRPVDGPVEVRAPGPRGSGPGSGLVGDPILDSGHHGGDDQAVYAYAREDLDEWAAALGRELPGGVFGENFTTRGVEVSGALVGEHWRVGPEVLLEVSSPRIPCNTFAHWMDERGWIRRFTERAAPGAYLRVLRPGRVRAGDRVEVVARPDHDVTVALAFRAMTREPELLPRLLVAEALPESVLAKARRRVAAAS